MMHGCGKSDSNIVAEKPTNKAGRPVAELVERRAEAKGNASQLRRRGEITESSNGWGGRQRHERWGFTGLRMKSITAT